MLFVIVLVGTMFFDAIKGLINAHHFSCLIDSF